MVVILDWVKQDYFNNLLQPVKGYPLDVHFLWVKTTKNITGAQP